MGTKLRPWYPCKGEQNCDSYRSHAPGTWAGKGHVDYCGGYPLLSAATWCALDYELRYLPVKNETARNLKGSILNLFQVFKVKLRDSKGQWFFLRKTDGLLVEILGKEWHQSSVVNAEVWDNQNCMLCICLWSLRQWFSICSRLGLGIILCSVIQPLISAFEAELLNPVWLPGW